MPVDLLTNAVASSASALALLLNPTTPKPAQKGADAPAVYEENLFGDWGGFRSKWSDHGFDFTVQYIGEVAGNVSGGVRRGAVYNGLLNFAADADLDKALGWKGGLFHAALLMPHGRSPTDHLVNDLFVLSNLHASDNAHLFELWLEQSLAEGEFSVRAGQIAVDQEFAFTEGGGLFNSSAFGWFPIVGATAPVYPQGAPGVRLKWQPTEDKYLQVAVVDGDVNPATANGGESNPHGTKFELQEGAFIIAEHGVTWEREAGPGVLKLGGWYHTADHDDVHRDDTGLSLASPASSGTPRNHQGNWGLYLAAEQMVWKESPEDKDSAQGFGPFGRLGYALPDRNTFSFYAEGGLTCTGLIPGRDDDVCGLGVAYGKIGNLRSLGRDQNHFNNTNTALPDYEMAIEFEYQWRMRPGFVVQPGCQYILHPGGSSAIDNAFVLTLRTVLDF